MATLHPAPRQVLMVGLSIGTWLAIAKQFPGVEQVDVVEINPGYLQAMRDYPVHAASLTDPRVRVVVDDARRWLRMHPDRRYDLVIMNTTLHWRSNTSLLLSREVLQVLKAHMAPGAVLSFNATGSGDAFYTATQVFAHAYRYMNFVYAAEFDFRSRKDEPRAREVYAGLRVGGEPLFAPGSTAVAAFLQQPFVTIQSDQGAPPARPFELITDDNMITEFKYGRPLYNWLDFVSF
jgi:SAM-dependent methyltransferase